MTHRSIQALAAIPVTLQRPTITTRDVSAHLLGDAMDPFLVTTLFEMTGPTFPPHPHAGFAVATYILPESATGFLNQDSTGHRNRITPGSLHATIAGSGVVHEEVTETPGTLARGFQIWLNVPGAAKHDQPVAVTLEAGDVPTVTRSNAVIRVLAGASNGVAAPIALPTPVRIVDVTLSPGGHFAQDLTAREHAFVWMIRGAATVPGATGTTLVQGYEAAAFARDGDALALTAGIEGARFLLFAGEPIGEPVVMRGPFVGRSTAEVDAFAARYRAGEMGHLAPFAAPAA